MIEINKPEGALRYKGCDSCGSHEDVITIRISNKNDTSGRTVCFCRDCAKLLTVGLIKCCDVLYGGPEKSERATKVATLILKEQLKNMEDHSHDE